MYQQSHFVAVLMEWMIAHQEAGSTLPILFVTGSEKRDHFVLNAFTFQTVATPWPQSRAPGLPLGLKAVWAFYFTDPTLEARAGPLSQVVSCQRHKMASSNVIDAYDRPTQVGSGRDSEFLASVAG